MATNVQTVLSTLADRLAENQTILVDFIEAVRNCETYEAFRTYLITNLEKERELESIGETIKQGTKGFVIKFTNNGKEDILRHDDGKASVFTDRQEADFWLSKFQMQAGQIYSNVRVEELK